MDTKFLKRYKRWLLQFNSLYDLGFRFNPNSKIPKYEFQNNDLEDFRDHPKKGFRHPNIPTRPRTIFRPDEISLKTLNQHHSLKGGATAWMVNAGDREILCLADIDAHDGEPDAQPFADWLNKTYFQGKGFIEPSTGGRGRHLYFILNVGYSKRESIKTIFKEFTQMVKIDPNSKEFKSHLCRIMGAPTLWNKKNGYNKIVRRGTLVKIPYVANGDTDLERLERLLPVDLSYLRNIIDVECYLRASPSQGALQEVQNGEEDTGERKKEEEINSSKVGQTLKPLSLTPEITNESNAFLKKQHCCGWMLRRTNGMATFAQVLDSYNEFFNPTGMAPDDISRRVTILKPIFDHFKSTFIESSFKRKRDQFLTIIKETVPPDAYEWERREVVNAERLADFVALKVQDAFRTMDNGAFASFSRDTTLKCFATLFEKQIVDWKCGKNQCSKLMKIAVEYKLLSIEREHEAPWWLRNDDGSLGAVVKKGMARQVAPGEALPLERQAWLTVLSRYIATPFTRKIG